jgi:hypothetical protein
VRDLGSHHSRSTSEIGARYQRPYGRLKQETVSCAKYSRPSPVPSPLVTAHAMPGASNERQDQRVTRGMHHSRRPPPMLYVFPLLDKFSYARSTSIYPPVSMRSKTTATFVRI